MVRAGATLGRRCRPGPGDPKRFDVSMGCVVRVRAHRHLLAVADRPAPLPDGWYDAYRWLLGMTPSVGSAEELTVEVCLRMNSALPAWLDGKSVDTRLRFVVAQVVLENRGVLDGRVPSADARRPAVGSDAAAESRHVHSATGAAGGDRSQPPADDGRTGGMRGARVAEILASLAAGGPAESWPAQLVANCRSATQTSGVGLAVTGLDGLAAVVAVTPGHARRMEDLQFGLGEGPCVDASRSGRSVLVPDLTAQATRRWPAFTPAATHAGVHAAFTFPLQVGAIGIGVLDLYRTTPGDLGIDEFAQALAFADAAIAVLLHAQDGAGTGAGGTGEDGSAPVPATEARIEVVRAVDRRAVVHQATGMISVQLGVSLAVALSRLRAHAYAADRRILDMAADVVDRRLAFDDSDAGTTQAPVRRRPSITEGEEPS